MAEMTQPKAPPAAEINALPERMRQYVHYLETNADPAGDKWRLLQQTWEIAGLKEELRVLRKIRKRQSNRLHMQGGF